MATNADQIDAPALGRRWSVFVGSVKKRILDALSAENDLRESLLANSATPADTLRLLVQRWEGDPGSAAQRERLAVAGNPATPPDILGAFLGRVTYSDQRRYSQVVGVAGNEATPVASLICLATAASSVGVLRELAGNPILPAAQLPAQWWNEVIAAVDPHAALVAASRDDLPAGVKGVEHFALSRVRETLQALENGAPVVAARRWSQLPNRSSVPFPLPPSLVSAIEGQRLCGLRAEVVRSGMHLIGYTKRWATASTNTAGSRVPETLLSRHTTTSNAVKPTLLLGTEQATGSWSCPK